MGSFTLISVAPRESVAFSFKVSNLSLKSFALLSLFSKFRFRRCSSQNKLPLAAGRLQSQHNPARCGATGICAAVTSRGVNAGSSPAWRFPFFCVRSRVTSRH
jgi:hypothetical protein